ncbi:nucleotide sugar dehydrogenase [Halobacterium wangiae]|uniref:nucleotide sugar dehydrogenase n=1 Tax=Halobacterium wangiae TaxID=2902623 RepID=UPI001E5F44AF|nr:nucleotide sugar dehydrogenase [Halobacterium wangiae]
MSGSRWDPSAPVTTAAGARRRSVRAAVVGVGTVGLHRAVTFDDADVDVVGYDVDESVVAKYRRGVDATGAVGDARVAESDCSFTTDSACIRDADVVFVAVPTRHDTETRRSLPTVRAAAETVGEQLTPDTTVILESTVPPGGTSDVFTPTLEATANMTAGEEFAVAYSPARLSPGNREGDARNPTKLVAAEQRSVARDVAALYERVFESVHVVRDPAIAAAAKCVENVYRDVTIALVNELAAALDALDLAVDDVLDAAATKWNVPRLDPGLVGGTCLPDDPHLFADRVERAGGSTPLVRAARAVNEAVPERVAETTVAALADRETRTNPARDVGERERSEADATLRGSGASGDEATVLLLGLAYKPDVADLSGTRCDVVAARLAKRGIDVVGYDPLVDAAHADRALSVDVRSARPFENVDGVVVLVGHSAFDDLTLDDVAATNDVPPVVVDVPRSFDHGHSSRPDVVYRCP